MPSTNSEDDFAQNVALADTPMGLGSVVKAELGGDGDLQFRFLHGAVEFFELVDARFGVIRNNPQTVQVGQSTEDNCSRVRSFFFISKWSDRTSRKSVPFWTSNQASTENGPPTTGPGTRGTTVLWQRIQLITLLVVSGIKPTCRSIFL